VDEVEFWEADGAGRLKNLARCPVYPLRQYSELVDAAGKVTEEDEKAAVKMILPEEEDVGEIPQPDRALRFAAFTPRALRSFGSLSVLRAWARLAVSQLG
jgi:hypothetical protein